MDTFMLLVVAISTLLSNGNTLYMLQPPDDATELPLTDKTNTTSTIYVSQLENAQNNSKSVEPIPLIKDTKDKVSVWLSILAFAKNTLLDKNSQNNVEHNTVKSTTNENKEVDTHAQSSKKVKHVDIASKNFDSLSSSKSVTKENSTNVDGVERKIEVIESTIKNVESPLLVSSLSREKLSTAIEEEIKFKVVETASKNMESSLSFNTPSTEVEVERKVEVVTTKNKEIGFTSESPPKGMLRIVEVVQTDPVNVESSISRSPKKNSTKVNSGEGITKKVLVTDSLGSSLSNISEKDSKIIASNNICDSSSSLCRSSQMCPYVLVIVGSFFFCHTVIAFW